jgi:hypothetical protein
VADEQVHVEGIGIAQGLRRPLSEGERRCRGEQGRARRPRQQPHERQGPCDVPRKQHGPEQHQHHEGPSHRGAEILERRAIDGATGHVAGQPHERHPEHQREHDPTEPAERAEAQPSEDLAREDRRREPPLVPGELEHAERRVVCLQVGGSEEHPDRDGEADVRRGRAYALSRRGPRDAPHQHEQERQSQGGLDQRADGEHRHRRERAIAEEQQEARREGERDEQIVVPAGDRMEQDDRVQPERGDRERRPLGTNPSRGHRDQRDGREARQRRDPTVGADLAGGRRDRARDGARDGRERRPVHGRCVDPPRPDQWPQFVARELDGCAHVGVLVVHGRDAPVERVGVHVTREQQRHQRGDDDRGGDREPDDDAQADRPAPGRLQQREEPDHGEGGCDDARRDQPGASEPIEPDRRGERGEGADRFGARRQHRLEGRTGRRGEDRARKEARDRERDRPGRTPRGRIEG